VERYEKLYEEWVDSVKTHLDTYEIFSNPKARETQSIGSFKDYKEVRGILDYKKNKTYVFDIEFLHDKAIDHLKLDTDDTILFTLDLKNFIIRISIENRHRHDKVLHELKKNKFIKRAYTTFEVQNSIGTIIGIIE